MKDFKHPLFDEVIHYKKVGSTMNEANRLIKSQQIAGNFLLIADKQTSGIGRKGNSWFSPNGGIWLTAALYGVSIESSLTIFTGICLHKSLCDTFPQLQTELKIKWPNDIFLRNRKLAGILTNYLQFFKYHLIGIGINSNVDKIPEEISQTAISLKKVLGEEINNEKILKIFFDIFAAELPSFVEGTLDRNYFLRHSFLLGKKIVLDTDFDRFTGIVKGIDKKGALLLELKPGMIQPFLAGTVTKFYL